MLIIRTGFFILPHESCYRQAEIYIYQTDIARLPVRLIQFVVARSSVLRNDERQKKKKKKVHKSIKIF